MKLYILKLYGTPHKWQDDCDIGGYYTNVGKLIRALKSHYDELGICDGRKIDEWVYTPYGEFDISKFNTLADLASIEVEYLNEWTA